MTGGQLQQALNRMQLTQAKFAEMIGMATETVNRWCNDKKPIPKWAALIVRLSIRRPARLAAESERLSRSFVKATEPR